MVLIAIKCGPIAGFVCTTSRRVVYGLLRSEFDSELSEFFVKDSCFYFNDMCIYVYVCSGFLLVYRGVHM